jgi:hypothetical protein
VAAKLLSRARRSGKSFKEILNEVLRRGLIEHGQRRPRQPFKVKARNLGRTRPGVSLDDIGGLLERMEGERHG